MTVSLAQLRVAACVFPGIGGGPTCLWYVPSLSSAGWSVGERRGHCSQAATEAEVYSLPPGPDVLVGDCLCQSGALR